MFLENVTKWIATQLDKLKIANPWIFLALLSVLGFVDKLFIENTWNITTPEFVINIFHFFGLDKVGITDLDSVVIFILSTVIALVGPRTTSFLKSFGTKSNGKNT